MLRDEAEMLGSAIEARKIVLWPAEVKRYLNPTADTAFPLEYAFHLLGDIRGKQVLDLGCGTGGEIATLARRGARVIGIDISPDLICLARERMRQQNIEADLRVSFAHQTELPDGSVDVIFCMTLIHRLDIPMAMAEMRRILKPDGFIVMNEPICFSRRYAKLRAVFPASDEISEYEHPLTTEEFAEVQKDFRVSALRFFRLPFVPIAQRYLHVKAESVLKLSNIVLRRSHYLEHFATIAVMKLETPPPVNQRRMRILDLGCGRGIPLDSFKVGDGEVFGLDVRLTSLSEAARRFPRRKFFAASAEALPFRTRSMEKVVSNVALPYMNIPQTLREIHRVLLPGGTFTASLHYFDYTFSELRSHGGLIFKLTRFLVLINGLLFHLTGWVLGESFQTERGMRIALRRAGFVNVKFFHLGRRWLVESAAPSFPRTR